MKKKTYIEPKLIKAVNIPDTMLTAQSLGGVYLYEAPSDDDDDDNDGYAIISGFDNGWGTGSPD